MLVNHVLVDFPRSSHHYSYYNHIKTLKSGDHVLCQTIYGPSAGVVYDILKPGHPDCTKANKWVIATVDHLLAQLVLKERVLTDAIKRERAEAHDREIIIPLKEAATVERLRRFYKPWTQRNAPLNIGELSFANLEQRVLSACAKCANVTVGTGTFCDCFTVSCPLNAMGATIQSDDKNADFPIYTGE
jgi:hypothetical protein